MNGVSQKHVLETQKRNVVSEAGKYGEKFIEESKRKMMEVYFNLSWFNGGR